MAIMFCGGLIVCILVATCHSLPASDGALSRHKRVIGGDVYGKREYPFHVSLWYMGDNNPYTANTPDLHHTCGGSLIEEQWVLTSGSCFDDNFLPGLGNTSLWKVYLGMFAQMDAESEAQYHSIQDVFIVPEHNLKESYGDLALLKLENPANLSNTVGLVEVNGDPYCPEAGQDVNVIGWGQTQDHTYGLGSNVPYKTTVKVSTLKHCKERYLTQEMLKLFGESLRIDDRNLCAGVPEGGKDSCYGDSGSPLLATCKGSKHTVVVGTVSYGYGCAQKDYPAVYTRVSAYKDWIQSTINDNP